MRMPDEKDDTKLQMSPLIDMVFLLIIFFMTASHMSSSKNMDLDIPSASNGNVPKERPDRWTVNVLADGRYLSRVIDNLLENVYKYAMPGTRLYLDVQRADGRVQFVCKNVSRERLNVDPEELKEQIQSAIDEYNSSIGSENIELKKCRKDKENVQVVISYKSGEDYTAFNGVACYTGRLADIVNSGAIDTSIFVTSSDGGFRTTVGELNAKSGTELNILVIEEPMTVSVPKDIQYIGGDVVISKGGTCVTGSESNDDTILDSPCYIIYGRR